MTDQIIKYKIFHPDRVVERLDCVNRNRTLFEKYGIDELDCKTQDFSTFKVMDDFIECNPTFKIKRHNNYPAPFPHVSGVIGVWASNWVSYKALLESDANAAILLEDDTVLKENFFQLLPSIIENVPQDWDVVSFCIPNTDCFEYSLLKHWIDNPIITKMYQKSWAGGYIINRSGADKIVSWVNNHGIDMPIDWLLFTDLGIINVYNISPYIEKVVDVDPDNVNSYIGQTEGI